MASIAAIRLQLRLASALAIVAANSCLAAFADEPPYPGHAPQSQGVSVREAMWGTSRQNGIVSSQDSSGVYYEILSRPATKKSEIQPRTWAPEVIRPVTPYAYGWFGASGEPKMYRQFGHQHSYINYSRR